MRNEIFNSLKNYLNSMISIYLFSAYFIPQPPLRGEHPLTGVNNVKATDRRRRYGSDGAQPCAQHRKPWLYRLYFQPFP